MTLPGVGREISNSYMEYAWSLALGQAYNTETKSSGHLFFCLFGRGDAVLKN